MVFNKRVLHSDSLAKYAAAFFMISISIFSRASSARSREISICSGVIGLPLAASPSLPAACAFTQLRTDCSVTPISRATLRTASPLRTRRNASSLNSSVYDTFGTLFIEHLPHSTIIPRRCWCPRTVGKLNLEVGWRLPLTKHIKDSLLGIFVLHRRTLRTFEPADHVLP